MDDIAHRLPILRNMSLHSETTTAVSQIVVLCCLKGESCNYIVDSKEF